MLSRLFLIAALVSFSACKGREDATKRVETDAGIQRYALILEPLINIEKLDGLAGKRAATPRLRKACYWLEDGRRKGLEPVDVITTCSQHHLSSA